MPFFVFCQKYNSYGGFEIWEVAKILNVNIKTIITTVRKWIAVASGMAANAGTIAGHVPRRTNVIKLGVKMMKNNAVEAQGIEVYTDEIYRLADEYIDSLTDDPDEIKSLMRKAPAFRGMLKYIYINLFKITDKDIKYNNKNSRIDYSDIELLNSLWDIYFGLCSKYLQIPTILNFGLFTGIDSSTFDSWKNGRMRGNISDNEGIATSEHSNSYKKWLKECESAAYDSALTGNPGAMFILKANYGYTEQPQKIEIIGNDQPQATPEQIAARYAAYKELPDNG